MDRLTVTEVSNLQEGDRFYKQNDKRKTVLEIVPGEKKITEYQTYSVWAKRDGRKFADPMKGNTMVVFLRHKE